jgi:hypothetical protein
MRYLPFLFIFCIQFICKSVLPSEIIKNTELINNSLISNKDLFYNTISEMNELAFSMLINSIEYKADTISSEQREMIGKEYSEKWVSYEKKRLTKINRTYLFLNKESDNSVFNIDLELSYPNITSNEEAFLIKEEINLVWPKTIVLYFKNLNKDGFYNTTNDDKESLEIDILFDIINKANILISSSNEDISKLGLNILFNLNRSDSLEIKKIGFPFNLIEKPNDHIYIKSNLRKEYKDFFSNHMQASDLIHVPKV